MPNNDRPLPLYTLRRSNAQVTTELRPRGKTATTCGRCGGSAGSGLVVIRCDDMNWRVNLCDACNDAATSAVLEVLDDRPGR